ncbi:HoxN/HupN/NixA family nickel/cobalt transporter [Acetobacter sp.]|jgi:high-affinity nickel-transport protein|uniref:HoxN/HupN/NixA family nickel/cobalt transporter n=1 Tax=Acetobacter sp. TaxID=440 RepID=UPI0025BA3C1B|nr:HoxN/HupN/NixA family nickel/cobalt transporter [Acetobacter sp.]MCH4092268.1 HoxN/HupN/NixA family nickel/cobalt transporter [Acetobacter sp.]MCI1299815.1 HoxN/HupN/NixA family nickel/cobalt transporter [Acetobacter sp.]MCI1315833.1 HoxN/HupN/NixA family nickel/cobalt transporter [Acetobacter sp.]
MASDPARRRQAALPLRIIVLGTCLVLANLAIWFWALLLFRQSPVLLGNALIAYGFGLRHAVDADHIAAIDNVTRQFIQRGKRSLTLGLWFALGHSTLVVIATFGTIVLSHALQDHLGTWRDIGSVVGTLISAGFLFILALTNLLVLRSTWRTYRKLRDHPEENPDIFEKISEQNGVLTRFFRPLFRLISKSWHMFFLGFLFSLGFDTATEVSLLGLSASEASHGIAVASIMMFPALFAAGMSLVDTADGVLMTGAYQWAFVDPLRKLRYNIAITLVSALVALVIGSIEMLDLVADRFNLRGKLWNIAASLGEHFNTLGLIIIGMFVLACAGSALLYRYGKNKQPV